MDDQVVEGMYQSEVGVDCLFFTCIQTTQKVRLKAFEADGVTVETLAQQLQ
jgi:hypothetical protein